MALDPEVPREGHGLSEEAWERQVGSQESELQRHFQLNLSHSAPHQGSQPNLTILASPALWLPFCFCMAFFSLQDKFYHISVNTSVNLSWGFPNKDSLSLT